MSDKAEAIALCLRRGHDVKVRKQLITQLAEDTGWSPKKIAEKTGYTIREVHRILPEKLKKKRKPSSSKKTKCLIPPSSELACEDTPPVKPRTEPNLELIRKTNYLIAVDVLQRDLETEKIFCPQCGGRKLVWGCCKKDALDPAYVAELREAIRA